MTGADVAAFVTSFEEREFGAAEVPTDQAAAERGEDITGESAPGRGAARCLSALVRRLPRRSAVRGWSAAIDVAPRGREDSTGERSLTTVDRYYLAWMEYQTEHGVEPTAEQLSARLAEKGMHGRGEKPISPANLRRYFLPSRVYNVWAEYRMRSEHPAAGDIAQECAARGITAQYNRPVTTDYITDNAVDFERRWQALTATTPTHSSSPASVGQVARNPERPRSAVHSHRHRDHHADLRTALRCALARHP